MKTILAILTSKVFYGKERSNVEVYQLLREHGFDVTVVISGNAEKRLKEALRGLNVIEMECPDRHDKSISFWRYLVRVATTNLALKKLLRKKSPDYLFVNNEFSIYDFNWAIKSYKGKIIYRLGDAPAYPQLRFYKFNSAVWNEIAVRRVNTFVCISNYIKQKLEATGRRSDRDCVIYNYPPARPQSGKDVLVYKREDSETLVFGFIGQIIESKGVAFFVSAAKRLLQQYPKCHFLVAGNLGYDKIFGDKIRLMVSDELKMNIHLLGEIDDIGSFYKSIDVLCVPSIKQEPLGNIIVEAKKYSKPCVIFPSGGMPELVTHLRDGFICEKSDEQSLFDGMQWYCENWSCLEIQSKNAFDSITQLGIDRASFEKKWMAIFE